jgi:hypothetical protein
MFRASPRQLLFMALVSAALLVSCIQNSNDAQTYETQPYKAQTHKAQVLLRKDFEAAVIGKNPDEVIASIGRPDSIITSPSIQRETWIYEDKTKDSVTGRVDLLTQLAIQDGRVMRVSFQ